MPNLPIVVGRVALALTLATGSFQTPTAAQPSPIYAAPIQLQTQAFSPPLSWVQHLLVRLRAAYVLRNLHISSFNDTAYYSGPAWLFTSPKPFLIAGVLLLLITGSTIYVRYARHIGRLWETSKSRAEIQRLSTMSSKSIKNKQKEVLERRERALNRLREAKAQNQSKVDNATQDSKKDTEFFAAADGLFLSAAEVRLLQDPKIAPAERPGGVRYETWLQEFAIVEKRVLELNGEGQNGPEMLPSTDYAEGFLVLKLEDLIKEITSQRRLWSLMTLYLKEFSEAMPALFGGDRLRRDYESIKAGVDQFRTSELEPEEALWNNVQQRMRERVSQAIYAVDPEFHRRWDHRNVLRQLLDLRIRPLMNVYDEVERELRRIIASRNEEAHQRHLAILHTADVESYSVTDRQGNVVIKTRTVDNSDTYERAADRAEAEALNAARHADGLIRAATRFQRDLVGDPAFDSEGFDPRIRLLVRSLRTEGESWDADRRLKELNAAVRNLTAVLNEVNRRLQIEIDFIERRITENLEGQKERARPRLTPEETPRGWIAPRRVFPPAVLLYHA